MRRYLVVFLEEGKVRNREVVAPTADEATGHILTIQGAVIVRCQEVCDGCDGLIGEGFESPLNGDDHYCESCTALDALAEIEIGEVSL